MRVCRSDHGCPVEIENISLIGMPGVGKSTVGRILARRLGLRFVDLDQVFELRFNMPISAYFNEFGEQAFRIEESKLLLERLAEKDQVLSTGGGCVLADLNRLNLREKSTVVYLNASPEVLVSRVSRGQHRPLFHGMDAATQINSLLAKRVPLYESTAHFSIDIGDRKAQSIAAMIVGYVCNQ